MREIKFRAWNKLRNKMTPSFNIYEYAEDNDSDYGDFILPDEDEGFIMQYTGLRDKNGKRIFEGDIISTGISKFNEHDEPYIGYIFYADGCFRICGDKFMCRDKYYVELVEEGNIDIVKKSYEVIGNIYENPEILIETKQYKEIQNGKS